MLLNDTGEFINQSHESLRLLHEHNVMPGAFQALLRQGTAMAWGAFEVFCFDIFRLLFTEDLARLDRIALAKAPGTPWGDTPQKLVDWIRAAKNPALPHQDAFDTFKNLPSMSLRASRHFSGVLFPEDAALLSLLDASDLMKLSARRHLLLHAAGIVDDQYVKNSREALPIGSKLMVTPLELALGFRAASSAGAALARAAAGIVT